MLNYKTTILLITATLILGGCDLSEPLRSDISADAHYSDVEGFEDLSVAIYQPLRNYYEYNGLITTASGVDIFQNGSSSGSRESYHTYDEGLNPSISGNGTHNLWEHFYKGINSANSLIERADGAEGITESQKTTWIAEARFMRAHYYYILVQNWGAVHLTLEETKGVETEASRTPEEEIWNVVIEDLEYAAENLPEEQDEVGRATANAAKHHLARVHLILENWNEAADWATEVIDSGQQRLIDSFSELFNPYETPIGEKNDETIWGIAMIPELGYNHFNREFAPAARNFPGIQPSFYIGQSSARYKPTEFFVTEIFNNDPTRADVPNHWNDERYQTSFKEVWSYNDPDGLPSDAAIGDTALYMPAEKKYQEMTNEEVEQFEEQCNCQLLRMQDWRHNVWTGMATKFRHRGDETPEMPISELGWYNPDYWGRTIPIFRLGETYLIAAEAYMMMGNMGEAVEYFNTIRERAEAPGEDIPLISSGELDIDAILDERARELAGEFIRWYDLKRTGKLLDRVREHNPLASPNIQEHHRLRPIPQDMIDRLSNNFPQNPGY